MQLAGVRPGMSVADIGAGEGYYTVRLAPRRRAAGAGCSPRTSCPRSATSSAQRVQRERLDNVAVKLGTARRSACCRPQSFDRIFLVHMYHEVQSPYAFLWHLRDGAEARRPGHRRRCRPAGQAATACRRAS